MQLFRIYKTVINNSCCQARVMEEAMIMPYLVLRLPLTVIKPVSESNMSMVEERSQNDR